MKECLKCGKQFDAKKPTRKFCSDSCRVMYNRKHGKKKEIQVWQMKVLYDSMLEAVEIFKKRSQQVDIITPQRMPPVNSTPTNRMQNIIHEEQVQLKAKSYDDYLIEKTECEDRETWLKIKEAILADPILTDKQKFVLTGKR